MNSSGKEYQTSPLLWCIFLLPSHYISWTNLVHPSNSVLLIQTFSFLLGCKILWQEEVNNNKIYIICKPWKVAHLESLLELVMHCSYSPHLSVWISYGLLQSQINSCSKHTHLMCLVLASFFCSRYFKAKWSRWTITLVPIKCDLNLLIVYTTSNSTFSLV